MAWYGSSWHSVETVLVLEAPVVMLGVMVQQQSAVMRVALVGELWCTVRWLCDAAVFEQLVAAG